MRRLRQGSGERDVLMSLYCHALYIHVRIHTLWLRRMPARRYVCWSVCVCISMCACMYCICIHTQMLCIHAVSYHTNCVSKCAIWTVQSRAHKHTHVHTHTHIMSHVVCAPCKSQPLHMSKFRPTTKHEVSRTRHPCADFTIETMIMYAGTL